MGPIGLSLDTANAELHAAQQRVYHAFTAEPAAASHSFHLHFDFTAGAASAAWPFEFQAGQLRFIADHYAGAIDVARQQGQLTFTSAQPFAAADYFVRAAIALLTFEAGGLLFHAAGLARHDRGYAFFGYSGSGKTTVARLSTRARVLNDDLVVLWPEASHPAARQVSRRYGETGAQTREARQWYMDATPFSNPTQVQPTGPYRVPLTALYRLIQDRRVFLEPLDPALALAEVVASSPIVCADPDRAAALLDRAAQLTRAIPVQRLHFLPDDSFWNLIDPG